MSFSIQEVIRLVLYLAIVFIVTMSVYKDLIRPARITFITAILIITGELIEAFLGDFASTIYIVSILVVVVFLYFKKPK